MQKSAFDVMDLHHDSYDTGLWIMNIILSAFLRFGQGDVGTHGNSYTRVLSDSIPMALYKRDLCVSNDIMSPFFIKPSIS